MIFRYPLLFILTVLGVFDACYLTLEHVGVIVPPCTVGSIFDCGTVLSSRYATLGPFPLSVLGLFHYILFCILLLLSLRYIRVRYLILLQSLFGFLFSLYLVWLQVFVIGALCFYCMVSATVSTLLFMLTHRLFKVERKKLFLSIFGWLYQHGIKPMLFLVEPSTIHTFMTRVGELIGSTVPVKASVAYLTDQPFPTLMQEIDGIHFEKPFGLAAGFDYEARLTRTLKPWGFGFQTVGTITNRASQGNPGKQLGRLPMSQALMVNKGFRNLGATNTIERLRDKQFSIPVGVSIGRTNLQSGITFAESVSDIMHCFEKLENSKLKHSYYELNISCPNLFGSVNFYTPSNLRSLLDAVDSLSISCPIYIKMPISETNAVVRKMLAIIASYSPSGIIIGNLQKDRKDKALLQTEVARFRKGNFSGKPTFERSNELIQLAFREFGDRFTIIGCGGVFSADDAYTKIKLGASLIQLITGLIFKGPQLVSQMNFGLEKLLNEDGFDHITEAVGVEA